MKCGYCAGKKAIKKGRRKNLGGKVRGHLGIEKAPCEALGMKRLSSRELVARILLFF